MRRRSRGRGRSSLPAGRSSRPSSAPARGSRRRPSPALVPDDVVDLVRAPSVQPGSRRSTGSGTCTASARGSSPGAAARIATQRRAPVDGERPERRPVVGASPRDELRAGRLAAQPMVLARELHHRLVRLRAAPDEEDAADVDREQLAELVGESERGSCAKPTQFRRRAGLRPAALPPRRSPARGRSRCSRSRAPRGRRGTGSRRSPRCRRPRPARSRCARRPPG